MKRDSSSFSAHPVGEQSLVVADRPEGVDLDSFFGPVRVEWDHEAAMTPLGQLPFFIDFLKTAGLFDAFVADCPLRYVSPNAPGKRDVLGTAMLSMLAGHTRYAHITALRCDPVLPELLGMKKIVSEDAVRRALRRSTRPKARPGCGAIWRFAWSRSWPSPGFSTSIRRSSRSMVIRKGRFWATIPRSRGVRAIAITPIRWLRRVWFSMSTSAPATSTRRNTAHRACGRSSTVCRAT